MKYSEKKAEVNKRIKEGKWNHSDDMSKDTKVCRVSTEEQDFPYNYEDSAHSTDYEKSKAKSPVRER
jgi:hypothetical protein